MDKKAEVIKRLYLTEDQLKEMSEMWPDGQEHPLVVQLRKWREANRGPWIAKTADHANFSGHKQEVEVIAQGETIIYESVMGNDANDEAIVHTRNRIELLTALHFWEITGWKAVFVGQKAENDKAIEACRVLESTSQDMLARIKEVLDGME